jgi:hypothetical protein
VLAGRGEKPAANFPVTPPRFQMGANIGRPISEYSALVETFRARADELQLSRAEIDRLGGMPDGYSGKLLGRAGTVPGANKKKRRMLPTSLDLVLGVLGLKIIFIVDEIATAKTLARRIPVDRSNQRFGNVCRISAKMLPPPQADSAPAPANEPAVPTPMVSHLRVIQGKRKGGSKYG